MGFVHGESKWYVTNFICVFFIYKSIETKNLISAINLIWVWFTHTYKKLISLTKLIWVLFIKCKGDMSLTWLGSDSFVLDTYLDLVGQKTLEQNKGIEHLAKWFWRCSCEHRYERDQLPHHLSVCDQRLSAKCHCEGFFFGGNYVCQADDDGFLCKIVSGGAQMLNWHENCRRIFEVNRFKGKLISLKIT